MDGTGEAIRLLDRELPKSTDKFTVHRSWGTSQSDIDDVIEILKQSPELFTNLNFKEFLIKTASLDKSDRLIVVKVVTSSLLQNNVRVIIKYPDGVHILAGKYDEPSYVVLKQNPINIKIPLKDGSFIEYSIIEKTTDIKSPETLFEETL